MRMSPSPSPVSCASSSPRKIDVTPLKQEAQPPKVTVSPFFEKSKL